MPGRLKRVKEKNRVGIILFLICLIGWSNNCLATSIRGESIVVSTSMLACAVDEVIPHDGSLHIISILPPGACPGHFDLKPDILPHLQQASLIIRHDYQTDLEKKLKGIGAGPLNVSSVQISGSLLLPDHYIKLTKEITEALIEYYPDQKECFLKKQKACQIKINQLRQTVLDQERSWQGEPVIAAEHQKQFVSYLGLEVVGILKRTEEMTPLDLKKLMQTKAVMIIGNYQSGADSAKSLAKRMHLPVAIVSNFPDTKGFGKGYQELIESNIEIINKAWAKK